MKMLKVLHISGARGWGGNEQQLINIIPEMNSSITENIVLLLENSRLKEECLFLKIPFIIIEKPKKHLFKTYSNFRNIINKIQPDIIHFHTSDFLTVYVLADLLFHIKTPTIYSRKSILKSTSFFGKLRYNYKNLTSIICVSQKVKDNFSLILSNKNKKKLCVIYDCVPSSIINEDAEIILRKEFSIPEKNLIIGNIANHNPAKDLKTLIQTANFLIHKLNTKNVTFIQIGEFTKLTEDLKNDINKYHLQDYFIFTNKLQYAYRYNQQFDIFIMTSEREGGPTAVLEAMLFEKPIVSTNVGIVPEIINNGKNGFISKIKDYQSLATNLDFLIKNEQIRKSILIGNKDSILTNNSAKIIAEKTIELYKKISQ